MKNLLEINKNFTSGSGQYVKHVSFVLACALHCALEYTEYCGNNCCVHMLQEIYLIVTEKLKKTDELYRLSKKILTKT